MEKRKMKKMKVLAAILTVLIINGGLSLSQKKALGKELTKKFFNEEASQLKNRSEILAYIYDKLQVMNNQEFNELINKLSDSSLQELFIYLENINHIESDKKPSNPSVQEIFNYLEALENTDREVASDNKSYGSLAI